MGKIITSKLFKYIPIIETIKTYKKNTFKRDLTSALTVAVVAIPQSMAYAIIAGVNPVYGLYTAIVSTILSSAFGSSNHLIAGPTNAISLLIASNMKYFMERDNAYEMLFLLTFMVGVIQVLFGVFKMGKALNYVSHAVIVGFTAGAGVLIALGQLNQLFGIPTNNSAQIPTLEKVFYVVTHLDSTNILALGLGLFTIAIILVCKKINDKLPGALIGIVLSMILVLIFELERSGIKLTGDIPNTLPAFKMIRFDMNLAAEVFSGALAIAVIGLVEALSISRSIAAVSHQKINVNHEFISQGVTNTVAAFFQCFAGSGSFTRSAINYFSGAVTRMSGVLSGITVAVILIFFAPYAKYISMPSLAGVIMVIAYSMVNKKEMRKISKAGKSDSIAMWVTFSATVLMPNLDWAIYAGIFISIVLYLRNTGKVPAKILVNSNEKNGCFIEKELDTVDSRTEILLIQIEGNLYFGSACDLESKLDIIINKSKIFILRMRRVVTIDITSLEVLRVFSRKVRDSGGTVIVCGVNPGLLSLILDSGFAEEIGRDNIFSSEDEIFVSTDKALGKAREALNEEKK